MKTQTLLGHPDKFTSSEFTVLISMVLGFSCEDTRKLLGLKHDKYESVCQGLFEKLGASNHYTGVKKAYHFRNPLESVRTMGQVEKIVDENVKKAVLKVLKKANLSDSNTFVPQQVFFRTYANGSKKTKVFLPNKNGDPVPVKKVRIREALNSAVKLKNNIDQYVNLRKNHHVLIYRDENQDLKEEVVSFWEAIKRKKSGAPLYQSPNEDCEMVTALHINDMFLLDVHDFEEPIEEKLREFLINHLYRVQKLSSCFYEFRHAYDNKLDATEYPNYISINNFGSKKQAG